MTMDKSPSLTTEPKPRRRAQSPHSLDQLDKAISRIYDAAVDSQLWPEALAEILRFVGNSGTHLWLMNGQTSEVTHSIHVNMPDKMIEEYNGDVIKVCPRWANARKHPDRTFLFDYQHIDEGRIDSNEYYHWLQTKGDRIRYYLGGRLRVGSSLEGFQSLAFRKQEGHSQKKHLERFSRILPHVQHAMQIGQQMGTWHFVAQSAVETLNKLSHGVVILDDAGKLMTHNQCAEQFLKSPYRILLKGDRLTLLDAVVDQQLQLLISQCLATVAGKAQFPGGTINIPGNSHIAPLCVHVYPMKLPPGLFKLERSAVVLFLFGPITAGDFDETVLRTVFGFTSAESRLVAAILKGTTISGASKKLRISINTARTQLKSIFARVGVHRQADLVRLVLPFVTGNRSR